MDAAYQASPERFVRKPLEPPKLPETAWINKPENKTNRLSSLLKNVSQKG
ncbi:hypothetical protein B0E53_02627 [Micromonospora sp. MH33]|nr:hypothetical protein B0E53_02627 [Micromonospora sp. MH33]